MKLLTMFQLNLPDLKFPELSDKSSDIKKYDNHRSKIDLHIDILLNLPSIPINARSSELHRFLSIILKSLSTLEAWGYVKDKLSDLFLVKLIVRRLDPETQALIENLKSNYGPLNCDELIKFLIKRTRALELFEINMKFLEENAQNQVSSGEYNLICPITKKPFEKFTIVNKNPDGIQSVPSKSLDVPKIEPQPVKHKQLTSSCRTVQVNPTKISKNSSGKSKVEDNNSISESSKTFSNGSDTSSISSSAGKEEIINKDKEVLLSTAIVLVNDSKGRFHHCRTLLDSTASFFVADPDFI
jgi:hypothetical protein